MQIAVFSGTAQSPPKQQCVAVQTHQVLVAASGNPGTARDGQVKPGSNDNTQSPLRHSPLDWSSQFSTTLAFSVHSCFQMILGPHQNIPPKMDRDVVAMEVKGWILLHGCVIIYLNPSS